MFAFTKLMQAMVASGSVSDPQFYLTTLLLNTSSTNGAQNNTFLDSSTNNFTITRNGNTTQGTFTPFSQTGWSNYFDGDNDDFSISSSANLTPASGDFTLECWIFPTSWASAGSYRAIMAGPTAGCMFFGQIASGFGLRSLATADVVYTATLPTVNTWTHVAVSRSGTTARLFINGALSATATDSTNFVQTQVVIANSSVAGTEDYAGYISNLRFVKGTAVYTSAFTPPTSSLTAITNTQLLTCQSNRFVDNSTNAFSLSVGGNTSVQAFSPFAPTAAYSTSVVGGSGYFDGSGDYLTSPSSSAYQFDSGDFTVEAWIYFNNVANAQFASIPVVGALYWQYYAGALDFGNNAGGSVQASWSPKAYTWYHLAAVRNGSTFTHYINGAVLTSGTAFNVTATGTLQIGYGGAGTFNGYMAGFRFVKGTAVYTAAFTPPTAPPTAITNTTFLLNFTNSGIYDSTAKNVLETVGNAQVSTTQAKWGTTSMYFDGSSTATLPSRQTLSLGSGNFTIECWVRLSSTGTETNIGQSKNYYTAGSNGNFVFRVGTTNLWRSFDAQTNQATIDGTFSWNTGQWYHVAWVRNSGTVTVYRDGTSLGSISDSKSLIDSANGITLCSGTTAYIDDLRITVGYARYTANFTAPTAAFPIQ